MEEKNMLRSLILLMMFFVLGFAVDARALIILAGNETGTRDLHCEVFHIKVSVGDTVYYDGGCPMPPIYIEQEGRVRIEAAIPPNLDERGLHGAFDAERFFPRMSMGSLWIIQDGKAHQAWSGFYRLDSMYNVPYLLEFDTDFTDWHRVKLRATGTLRVLKRIKIRNVMEVEVQNDKFYMKVVNAEPGILRGLNRIFGVPGTGTFSIKVMRRKTGYSNIYLGEVSDIYLWDWDAEDPWSSPENNIKLLSEQSTFSSPRSATIELSRLFGARNDLNVVLNSRSDALGVRLLPDGRQCFTVLGNGHVLTPAGWQRQDTAEDYRFHLSGPVETSIPWPDYYPPLMKVFMPGNYTFSIAGWDGENLKSTTTFSYTTRDFYGNEATPVADMEHYIEDIISGISSYVAPPLTDFTKDLRPGKKLGRLNLPLDTTGEGVDVVERWCDISLPEFAPSANREMQGFLYSSWRDINLLGLVAGVVVQCYEKTLTQVQEGEDVRNKYVVRAINPPERTEAVFTFKHSEEDVLFRLYSSKAVPLANGMLYLAKGQYPVNSPRTMYSQSCRINLGGSVQGDFAEAVSIRLGPAPFSVYPASGNDGVSVEGTVSPALVTAEDVLIRFRTLNMYGQCVNPRLFQTRAWLTAYFPETGTTRDIDIPLDLTECGIEKRLRFAELFWDGNIVKEAIFKINVTTPLGEELPGPYQNLTWRVALPSNGLPVALTLGVPSRIEAGSRLNISLNANLQSRWSRPWGYSIKLAVSKFVNGKILTGWITGIPSSPTVSWSPVALVSNAMDSRDFRFSVQVPPATDFWSYTFLGVYLVTAVVYDDYTGEEIYRVSSPLEIVP